MSRNILHSNHSLPSNLNNKKKKKNQVIDALFYIFNMFTNDLKFSGVSQSRSRQMGVREQELQTSAGRASLGDPPPENGVTGVGSAREAKRRRIGDSVSLRRRRFRIIVDLVCGECGGKSAAGRDLRREREAEERQRGIVVGACSDEEAVR